MPGTRLHGIRRRYGCVTCGSMPNYLDDQHRREAFGEAFLHHLINWERVASRLLEVEADPGREVAETASDRR